MANQVEKLAAKAMGNVKSGLAAAKGLKGVFLTLAKEHGESSVLMKRCAASHEREKRTELWEEVRRALLSHEKAEVKIVYPVLHERAGTEAMAQQHDREAQTMEEMIQRLEELDIESRAWTELFSKLEDTVQHHAHEEESDIFPAAMDALDEDEPDALQSRYENEKERVLAEL